MSIPLTIATTLFASLTPRFAELAALCWFYRTPILLLNCALSLLVCGVMVWLYREWLREEDWVRYFATAFGIFGSVYLLRLTNALWHPNLTLASEHLHIDLVETLGTLVGSPVINVCFALAAIALTGQRHHAKTWRLRSMLAVVAVSAAALELFGERWGMSPYHRWPDAIVSAASLVWLGYKLLVNIGVRRRPLFAGCAFVAALMYGLLNGLYALNVWLVAAGNVPELTTTLNSNLESLSAIRGLDLSSAKLLGALDAMVFATAALFKLGLFGGAVVLALRTLVVVRPSEVRRTLTGIIDGRVELLTDRGGLEAIGVSFEADLVSLCYTLPGCPKVTWWRWVKHDQDRSGEETRGLPDEQQSIVGYVIKRGERRESGDRPKDYPTGYLPYVDGMHSFVAVPMRYHGAIIGALNIEWRDKDAFTSAAVSRIQMLADCLAPIVHAKRQLLGLDSLIDEFSKLDLVDSMDRGESIQAICGALHKVLTPLGTGVMIERGFREGQVGALTVSADAEPDIIEATTAELLSQELSKRLMPDNGDVALHYNSVEIAGMTVGHLVFATARDADALHHPTLVDDQFYRKSIAALACDAIVDGRRARFARIIRTLDSDLLANPTPSARAWLEIVAKAARDVGLLWTVAHLPGEPDPWLGAAEHVQLAQIASTHPDFESTDLVVAAPARVAAIRDDKRATRCVLQLVLAPRNAVLWFGVSRDSLKDEIMPPWPWRVFLDALAASAMSALNRLRVQSLQFQASQDYAMVTASLATGSFVHELQNLTAVIALSSQNARRDFVRGEISHLDHSKRLELLENSVDKLGKYVELLINVQKATFDDQQPCALFDAVTRVVDLFEPILKQRHIDLHHDVQERLTIDVPLTVAYLSLANLVSNSINMFAAYARKTDITITARDTEDFVECAIGDNGPGVDSAIIPSLFLLNVSARKGGHGLGLYLTRRALLDNRSTIELTRSGPSGAVFTIKFRKPGR